MKDTIVKATAINDKVNIICAKSTNLVEQSRRQHDLWPTSCATLGRIETMGAMMASTLKNDNERIIITINGGGPIGTCMCEAKGNGDVRGFVGDNEIYLKYNDSNKLAVGLAVGKEGYLSVTKDLGLKDNFTGKVQLQSGEIGDDFAYYYAVSEQVPSVVSVGVLVNTDNSCKSAGGMIIQLMPDVTEEDIEKVEKISKELKPISELIDSGKTPEDIIKMYFDDAKILESKDFRWHCDCSKDKFKAALTTLSYDDLKEMLDNDHGCEVKCEYCNSIYHFDEKELESILEFKGTCGK